nr:hypothetical protein GCM10020063_009230 [Dactylosporangium thailandense]
MCEHIAAARAPGSVDARHGEPAATIVEHTRDVRADLTDVAECTALRLTSPGRGRVR